jgi:hypothetical protein
MVRALSILDIEPPCFLYGKDISTMEPLYPFMRRLSNNQGFLYFFESLKTGKSPGISGKFGVPGLSLICF